VIPKTIDGLPLHPLVIHATVVLLPVASLAVLLAGLWPRARRYLNVSPLVLSVLAVIVLALTYASGINLKDEIGTNPLIARHEHLAHQLLIPVLGLVVAAFLIEVVRRKGNRNSNSLRPPARADSGSSVLVVIAAVLAVVFAVGTTVQTVRVGEAGARAVWGHTVS
jgi:formate hydrogenlyase subunit 3/multisubunit Na+/H+ antiporter MnhD subunit